MLDEIAPYANEPESFVAPTISDKPTVEDIAKITRQMYAKTEERKTLSMWSRENVQKSFGGEHISESTSRCSRSERFVMISINRQNPACRGLN